LTSPALTRDTLAAQELPAEEVPVWGVMAEFTTADALLGATRRAYAAGYRAMDAYSPFPVDELAEALGSHGTVVPWITLSGGILGAITGYGLEYWVHAAALPINIGGRPLNSWPMFIPVTFELAVLGAGLFTLVGLLVLNRLPQPYHPVFNVPAFARASRDRFFLAIEARDPRFDRDATHRFLATLDALTVADVPE
jgi:Protein of unknown function (DUF3341)